MGKTVPLPTRAFGAEPGVPDIPALVKWVGEHRGAEADLTAYLLDTSLDPQRDAGITIPCAGGLFCRERVTGSLAGLNKSGTKATDDVAFEGHLLAGDVAVLSAKRKDLLWALPAPHMLGITDAYYGDTDEWDEALFAAYRRMMRDMRDTGAKGHILICEKAIERELAALAQKKVFFFVPDTTTGDLQTLLEYQRETAVPSSLLKDAIRLTSEYEILRLTIMDPDAGAIATALTSFDPDRIASGGYCTADCRTYWQDLVEAAVYRR